MLTREQRIVRKIATRCDRICKVSLVVSFLALIWMVCEVICDAPFTTPVIVVACIGWAVSMTSTYIGKTIEDIK